MQVTIDMPRVASCAVTNCAYNKESSCHARAITIGDARRPGCDTFLDSSNHCSETKRIAGVGACKVADCRHNRDFECDASEIEVGYAGPGKDVLCLTFAQR